MIFSWFSCTGNRPFFLFSCRKFKHQELCHSNQDAVTYSCFSFISGEKNLQEFPFPTLLHGEYDDSENVGVLVFLDLHTSNFKLCDPELQRISSHDQIEKVISTLGHFRTFLQIVFCSSISIIHSLKTILLSKKKPTILRTIIK